RETHAPEVIERSADGGVRHFVSRREGGEPDPQGVFVPYRLDGELRWRRQMREQGIEVDRHAANSPAWSSPQFSRYVPRFRGSVDGPTHHIIGIRSERKSARTASIAACGLSSGMWARKIPFSSSCGRPVFTRSMSGPESTFAPGIRAYEP